VRDSSANLRFKTDGSVIRTGFRIRFEITGESYSSGGQSKIQSLVLQPLNFKPSLKDSEISQW